MMTLLLMATIGVLIAGYVTYVLLQCITIWGGDRRDALDVTAKFIAEANAFRGSGSPDDPLWDGKNRIAPPTQDGGF